MLASSYRRGVPVRVSYNTGSLSVNYSTAALLKDLFILRSLHNKYNYMS